MAQYRWAIIRSSTAELVSSPKATRWVERGHKAETILSMHRVELTMIDPLHNGRPGADANVRW